MTAATIDTLLANLEKSQLLTDQQMEEVHQLLKECDESITPKEIGVKIIEEEMLTRWQVNMLLAGRNSFYLGRYKLLDRLGHGGMGSVFKAEQTPDGRIVALKVMAQNLVKDPKSVARFQRECQSAAALNHVNIVAAYDSDSVQNTHFLVMEYVDGEDLGIMSKRRGKIPIGEACEYIRQAASGLAHAHEKLMVHRDIKPSNLLVTWQKVQEDADGQSNILSSSSESNVAIPVVKILDMGLARLTGDEQEGSGLTMTGQIMGTPDYISPEQARNTKVADIRSDIFSLGCTIFRLITGELPFKGESVMEALLARSIGDAPLMSQLHPGVPPELDQAVAKMLAREPNDRLQTPNDVIEAVTPFCVDQFTLETASSAIVGRGAPSLQPGSSIHPERDHIVREFEGHLKNAAESGPLQKHSGSVGITPSDSTLMGSAEQSTDEGLHAPGYGTSPQAQGSSVQIRRQRQKRSHKRKIQLGIAFSVVCLAGILAFVFWKKSNESVLVVEWPLEERTGASIEINDREFPMVDDFELRITGLTGEQSIRLARKGYKSFNTTITLEEGMTKSIRPEWIASGQTTRKEEFLVLSEEFDAGVPDDPDDEATIALRSKLVRFARLYRETDEGSQARRMMSQLKWPIDKLNRSSIPAETLAAIGDGNPDDAPAELVAVFGSNAFMHRNFVHCVDFSADGQFIASGGEDKVVRLWEAKSGRLIRVYPHNDATVRAVSFSPDGQHFATGADDGSVRVFEIDSAKGIRFANRHTKKIFSLQYSPDGKTIVTGSEDSTIKLWNALSGEEPATLESHTKPILSVAFNQKGTQLVSGSADRTVKLWDLESRKEIKTFKEHEQNVNTVQFSPDGTLIASGSSDDTVKIWNINNDSSQRTLKGKIGDARSVAFNIDGSKLAISWRGGASGAPFGIWDTKTGEKIREYPNRNSWFNCLTFSPDGKTIASGGSDGAVRLWDATSSQEKVRSEGHRGLIRTTDISTDGTMLATASYDHTIKLWDLSSGKVLSTFEGHNHRVFSVDFRFDGKRLVSSSEDRTIRIWDVKKQEQVRVITDHTGLIHGVTFSPDGSKIASASFDQTVRIWDAETGFELHKLQEVNSKIFNVVFNPEGTRVAASADDWAIHIWDVETGEEKMVLKGHQGGVSNIEFSPNGKSIATSSWDQKARTWRASTGEKRRKFEQHSESTFTTTFDPSGRLLATAGADGWLFVWDADGFNTILKEFSFGTLDDYIVDADFSPDGRHLIVTNHKGAIYILRFTDEFLNSLDADGTFDPADGL